MFRPRHITLAFVFACLLFVNSCSEEFLEVPANGVLTGHALATYDGVDALLIGAYSMLDGVSERFGWEAATSGWVFSSIRGIEANKGSDSGDPPGINQYATFSETGGIWDSYLNSKWCSVYDGIARCNSTLATALLAVEAGAISDEQYKWFVRQARALRGYFHLEAWRLWADRTYNLFVPYVDEHTDILTLTNMEDIRSRIVDDLTQGTLLPLDMGQVGRFNRTVSQVFLAKALMQMYGDYESALALLSDVEINGTNPAGQKAGLEARYGDVFDIEFRNRTESIYTVQYSVNDGSGGRNASWGEVLNFPYKSGESPAGCCGFFQPTQDFVNSFRTDPDGLPYLYTYNDETVSNDQWLPPSRPWKETSEYLAGDLASIYDPADPINDRRYRSLTGTPGSPNVGNNPLSSPANWIFDSIVYTHYTGRLDPRVDWSAGRRGIPYWDWGRHTGGRLDQGSELCRTLQSQETGLQTIPGRNLYRSRKLDLRVYGQWLPDDPLCGCAAAESRMRGSHTVGRYGTGRGEPGTSQGSQS